MPVNRSIDGIFCIQTGRLTGHPMIIGNFVGDNAHIVPIETAGKRRDSSPCGFRMTGCLYVILSIAKDLGIRIAGMEPRTTYGVLQTVCGKSLP